jgi:myo-inositol-1-phosphate synthase
MKKKEKINNIRVGIIGVGNCASSLIQGVNYYKSLKKQDTAGVMIENIGGYLPTHIDFVLAFDVDERKVGKKLNNAVFAAPNCAREFYKDIKDDCVVKMGPILDGVAPHMIDYHDEINFRPAKVKPVDVVKAIRAAKIDVLINYLPVGSQKATEFYAQCAIDARVPFMNCIPVFIASNPVWEKKFLKAGLPLIGDDMKSMFGASIMSQALQETLLNRGHEVLFHSQLNVGGNSDFANMVDQSRLKSKKISKENVISSQHIIRNLEIPKDSIFAGPSSFVPYQKDNKVAYFRIEAKGFGGAPVSIDARLSVCDSENSAGVVIDAIRYLKVAQEMGLAGSLRGPSAWTQKTPPMQMTIDEALVECKALAGRVLTKVTQRQLKK